MQNTHNRRIHCFFLNIKLMVQIFVRYPQTLVRAQWSWNFHTGACFCCCCLVAVFFFPWGTFLGWRRIQAALLISSWQYSRDLDSAFGGLLHFRLQPIKPSPKLRCTEDVGINPSSLCRHWLPPLHMKNFCTQRQKEIEGKLKNQNSSFISYFLLEFTFFWCSFHENRRLWMPETF